MKDKNPTIAYDGHCAFAVSTGKLDIQGGRYSALINNKIYKFSNPIAKLLFKILPGRMKKADKYWNDSNASSIN